MSEPTDTWLLRRERGEDVLDVPADVRARYDQLADLIHTLPAQPPSAGWKARVLAELDKPRPCVTRTPWWQKPRGAMWLAIATLAMAAPGVAAVAWYRPTTSDRAGAKPIASDHVTVAYQVAGLSDPEITNRVVIEGEPFSMTIRPASKGVRRSVAVWDKASVDLASSRRAFAHVGDTLVLHMKADSTLDLRVYGDSGEPLARCATLLDCSLDMIGGVPWLRLEVPLRTSGSVTAVLFTGRPGDIRFRDLNLDLEQARHAETRTREVAAVRVR